MEDLLTGLMRPTLAAYGITELWQYVVVLTLPVFAYLVLDRMTKR